VTEASCFVMNTHTAENVQSMKTFLKMRSLETSLETIWNFIAFRERRMPVNSYWCCSVLSFCYHEWWKHDKAAFQWTSQQVIPSHSVKLSLKTVVALYRRNKLFIHSCCFSLCIAGIRMHLTAENCLGCDLRKLSLCTSCDKLLWMCKIANSRSP
jgi:hypothetical protein